MGARITRIGLAGDLIEVNYNDNGTSDTITKSLPSKEAKLQWLNMWWSDLSGGADHLERAIKKVRATA